MAMRPALPSLLACALAALALTSSAAASSFPGANGPIVFTQAVTNGSSIMVAGANGSSAHAVSSPPAGYFDNHPRFSADAGWVAFERSGFPSASTHGYKADHVLVMRADGTCVSDLSQ